MLFKKKKKDIVVNKRAASMREDMAYMDQKEIANFLAKELFYQQVSFFFARLFYYRPPFADNTQLFLFGYAIDTILPTIDIAFLHGVVYVDHISILLFKLSSTPHFFVLLKFWIWCDRG